MKTLRRAVLIVISLLAAVAILVSVRLEAQENQQGQNQNQDQKQNAYIVHNLVSDGSVKADHTDQNLVNPWGVVFNPTAFVWVADNGKGVSTLYDGAGNKQSLVVTVPIPTGGTPPSKPTGIVFSGGADFVVTQGSLSGPSRFIFATEDGTISGWAPNVDPTNAIRVVDVTPAKPIYKGLALGGNGAAHFLYATDFHNGRIDVFDSTFKPVTLAGKFSDPSIPKGYGPFGIQNILGNLYVTYAKQDADKEDDVAGAGFGFVDVFDANGQLIRRFAARGTLNAPWGLALAPADFGRFSNALLVGNFGDGRINAYDLSSRAFLGQLRGKNQKAVTIEGLWGIVFGNGVQSQPTNTLFFAAGPNDEMGGLYGRIDPS